MGAHRNSAPLLEPVEAALDDIAALVAFLLLVAEVDRPARLFAAVRDLSSRSGIVAAMPRSRSQARFALDGYPLSARTRSGRVRGRPFPARGTRMSSSTAVIIVVSLMFPPVIIIPNGLSRPSQTRCSLVVSPPRERPIP